MERLFKEGLHIAVLALAVWFIAVYFGYASMPGGAKKAAYAKRNKTFGLPWYNGGLVSGSDMGVITTAGR